MGDDGLKEESTKITLPKELQEQMMKFFLKTSIPRKKKQAQVIPSETKSDGSDKE